jgi:hypothetical protein
MLSISLKLRLRVKAVRIRGRRTQQNSRDWRSRIIRQRPEVAIAPQKSTTAVLDSNRPLRLLSSKQPLSSKQLDLLLLAACSCLLAFLCHPTINSLQSSPNGTSSAMESSLPSTSTQANFYVKSALMSTFQRGKSKEIEKAG